MLTIDAGLTAPVPARHSALLEDLPASPAMLPEPGPSVAGIPGGRVLFIDPGVADAASLLAGAEPGVRAFVLDSRRCGLDQMARILAGCTGLSGVCVIAHGTSGSLRLGSARLEAASLAAHGPALAAIGAAIAPAGTLALHGCRVGEGAAGRALVDRLGRATGVAVAAASHLVGGAAGASWHLDVLSAPVAPPKIAGRARRAMVVPPVAADVLRGYAHTLTGAPPPPPGYPFTISNFGTPSATGSFLLTGSASVSGAALTLTPDRTGQTGLAIYSAPISPQNAITIRFTYNSSGGNGTAPNPSGGDGIALFLLNGDSVTSGGGLGTVQPGQFGGGLGYSNTGTSPGAGITDGFLGIGFDTYGNFAGTSGNQSTGVGPITGGNGPGVAPETVVIRGQEGSGGVTTGYAYSSSATYAPGIDGTRDVQVNLSQVDATHEQVDVFMRPAGGQAFTEVLSTTVTQRLPGQLYFGFSSGTGGYDDLHQIDSVAVTLPVALALGTPTVDDLTTATVNPTFIHPGDRFNYTYTVTNSGPNADSEITLSDLLPANIEAGGYTVTDSAGSHSGTGGAIPVNLTIGAVATIVVSGTVNPNATPGNANHTATVSTGVAFVPLNPNASTIVALPIGPAGSSVSLVDANGTASATGTTPTQPLAAALVIDTYTAPGALPDTLTVAIAPSAGTLSSTDATYNAATGTLTATGTAAQLQAILDGVTFTPSATHTTAPGMTSSLAITVTATDPNAADSSGGGTNTATQTTTVQVTAPHDAPSVTGGTAGQPVSGNATVAPFGALAVTDPDDTSLTATVTILGGAVGRGSFTAASSAGWMPMTVGDNLVYTRTFAAQPDIAAAAQAGIDALVFQPGPLAAAAGASVTTSFAVAVTDGLGLASVADTLASVTDSPAGGLLPFLPLSATGSDAGQIVTVTAALPPGTAGSYSRLGSGFIAPDGLTYVVSGTNAQVTAALHTVIFTPADPTIATLPESFTALVVGATSTTTLADVGAGNSVLVAGSGSDTLTSGVGTDSLYGSGASSMLLGGGGNDLFVASTGDSTVFAGTGNAMVYGNTGPLVFVNSGGDSTVFTGSGFAGVFGGAGTLQAYGGAGGGVFYGGTAGNNVIVAGNGASSILGGGNGDRLTTNSAALDVLAAGQGNETLVGTGSSGNNLYFAGGGNALIAAGTGSSLVMAGSGQDSIFTGATGSATIFGATGGTLVVEGHGTATFAAGSGSATVDGGTGADFVSIVDGHAGGSVTLNDFKPDTDQVGLYGYAPGQLAQALASAATAGGSTTLTLSDHTRLVFSGIAASQLAGSIASSS